MEATQARTSTPCLGIDPGKGGALAVTQNGAVCGVWKTPETNHARAALIAHIKQTFPGVVAAVERPLFGFSKKRTPKPGEPKPMTREDLGIIGSKLKIKTLMERDIEWLICEVSRRFEEDDERKFSNPTSIGKLNKDAGIWCGILEAYGIPYEEPTPQQWGKVLNGRAAGTRQKDRVRDFTSKRYSRFVHGPRGGYLDGHGDAIVISLSLEGTKS